MLFIIISCVLFDHGLDSTTSPEDITTTEVKSTSCGPMESTISEEDSCYMNSVDKICPNSSPDGTFIVRQCRPPYYPSSGVVLYICSDGQWAPSFSICLPDCGLPTKNNEYPWIVAIYNANDDLVCTGTIISQFHVVTSVECFEMTFKDGKYKVKYPENYLIIAGKHHINIHKRGGTFQKRMIKSSAVSSLTVPRDPTNLILLTVDREFEFLEKNEIRPICIDWDSIYTESDLKDGNEGSSIEWEYDKDQVVPCRLRNRFNVQYWQRHTCLKNIKDFVYQFHFDVKLLCAEYINANYSDCGKGLGAGLFFKSNEERYFLRGILYPLPFLRDKTYQFYIKLTSHYEWLKDEITKYSNTILDFSTHSWHSPNDNTGCILPKNVEHGKFVLTTGNNYVEGKWVPTSTMLLLYCDIAINSSPLSYRCNRTVWTPSIDEVSCRPAGTCPSIPTTASDRVVCKLNGGSVSCKNPPNNATAFVRCKPFHTYPGIRPIYKCQNGEWDQPFTPCILECGVKRVRATELVIGGEYTAVHEYPWVVAIYDSNDTHICGGSIISKKFVLSAAHCFFTTEGVFNDKAEYTIVAGKYYRDMKIEEQSAQKRKIKSIYVHDDYRGRIHKYRDDVALIEVDEDFVAKMEVEPVCVDWDNVYEDYDFVDGNLGVVTGWGATTESGTPSAALKKLSVPFRDKRVCLENLPSEFAQQFLVNDKICAGYRDNNTNVCNGDSGGGLYFKSDDKRYFIRGITSIAPRSEVGCDSNRFALYTKVSAYLSWLESITLRD